jgi:hypothetical protein
LDGSSIVNRYIFTVTAGRSGQNTLTNLIENHVKHSYVAFEEPKIDYIFKGKIASVERKFRRSFIETHELLGRGKVLTSFVDGNVEYIESIAKKRVSIINKKMKKNGDQIYVDISKYFARGLHIGFQKILPTFSLIHLVRDPILNMRSFLNRNKNFYLDNNSPGAESNLLRLDPNYLELSDLYLWAWFEMALRYENMKQMECIDRYIEIYTDQLNSPDYMNQCLDDLGIVHNVIKENHVRLNTNTGSGYKKTEITKYDIEKFEKFIDKVPSAIIDNIPYLQSYNPHSIY